MTARVALIAVLVAACGGGKDAAPPPAPPPPMAKPQPVTIKLRNHRVAPIWVALPAPCASLPARLETKAGVQVPVDEVTVSCADSAAGRCGPPTECPGPRAIRIEGDGEVVVRWDGQVVTPRTLAKATGGCPTACVDRAGPPPATDYWLRAAAWSTCLGDDCGCAAAKPADGCPQPAGLTGPPYLKAATPIDIPSALAVTIMFE